LNCSKILELEEELKVVGNNMKSLEISEQEVSVKTLHSARPTVYLLVIENRTTFGVKRKRSEHNG